MINLQRTVSLAQVRKRPDLSRRNIEYAVRSRLEQLQQYRVDISTGCWIWLGRKDKDGYGKVKRNGKTIRAHRLFYEHHKGKIPRGLLVRHTCDNPPCVNPEHLLLGTQLDNERDKDSRGRRPHSPSLVCRDAMPRGEAHHNAVLTTRKVLAIRCSADSARTLARQYNVHPCTIHRIRSNKAWAHIQ